MKLRPVLLLTGPVGLGTDVIAAYISSVIPGSLLASDILLNPIQPEYRSTGLKTVSVLRLHKLATIHTTSIQRYLGKISITTQRKVNTILRQILSL
jgi:hypothetical protein